MRHATTAERILSLVTTADHAAGIVGDLLEENRGAIRFWLSVLQTAASHIVHDIWHHPFAILRAALAVFLELFVLCIPVFLVVNLIIKLWTDIAPYHVTPNSDYIPPWAYYCLVVGVPNAILFLAGWEVARQSMGRELATGIALLAVFAILRAVSPAHGQPDHVYPVPSWLQHLGPFCYLLGLVLCPLRARRRDRRLFGPVRNR